MKDGFWKNFMIPLMVTILGTVIAGIINNSAFRTPTYVWSIVIVVIIIMSMILLIIYILKLESNKERIILTLVSAIVLVAAIWAIAGYNSQSTDTENNTNIFDNNITSHNENVNKTPQNTKPNIPKQKPQNAKPSISEQDHDPEPGPD